jgi:hypothetical protein
MVVFASISATLMTFGLLVYLRGALAEEHPVDGTVRCDSGAAVRGVWVGNEVGGGDWAHWDPSAEDPATASYRFTVRGDRYTVHVGCGGSAKWAREGRSPYVDGRHNDFICYDRRDEPYPPCTRIGP